MECFFWYIFLGFHETSFNSRSQTKSNSILLYITLYYSILLYIVYHLVICYIAITKDPPFLRTVKPVKHRTFDKRAMASTMLVISRWYMGLSENVGLIFPIKYSHFSKRDNDQQNHWVWYLGVFPIFRHSHIFQDLIHDSEHLTLPPSKHRAQRRFRLSRDGFLLPRECFGGWRVVEHSLIIVNIHGVNDDSFWSTLFSDTPICLANLDVVMLHTQPKIVFFLIFRCGFASKMTVRYCSICSSGFRVLRSMTWKFYRNRGTWIFMGRLI